MPALIDWGTTHARAYLVDEMGNIKEDRRNGPGLKQVPGGQFADALDRMVAGWREPDGSPPRILMAGMVGSRQGWIEAPYARPPVSLDDLTAALTPVPDRPNVAIVPGMACEVDGHWDVMRGEETQLFGAMALDPSLNDGLFCLPGTHGKWARVVEGTLIQFRTAMTGELFALLCRHSLLATLMKPTDAPDWDAFRRGLERAGDEGGLLHHLFSARADALFGALPETGVADYLSGMLIGREILDLGSNGAAAVTVIADTDLAMRYERALDHFGRRCRLIDGARAAIAGLMAIDARWKESLR